MLHLLHILTVVLISLKLAGVTAIATLSWWVIIAPSILALILPLAITVLGLVFLGWLMRK